MKHISLDQSLTCTAVCIFDDDLLLEFHTIGTKKSDDPLQIFNRSREVADHIIDLIIATGAKDRLTIEGLALGNVKGNASRDLASLQAIIIDRCRNHVDEVIVTPPTQVKKFATGKGNAKKGAMFDALPDNIREAFGYVPKTKGRFDLTDAYFIGLESFERTVGDDDE